MDAQSVKNTDTAALKGYDAGKKVSGIKRHIGVDTQGLPHAVVVTTAEVTDRKGALQTLGRCKANLSRVQSVLADGGYVGEPFAQAVKETLGRGGDGADCQARRASLVCGHPQALGCGAEFCLAGQEQAPMEELRATSQYQFAVHPLGIPSPAAQEIVNTF